MIAVRSLWVIAVSTLAAALMVATLLPAPLALGSEPECAGLPATQAHEAEARRAEQGSTFLPDCRAYELVSQPDQPSPFYRHAGVAAPLEKTSYYLGQEEPSFLPEVQTSASPAIDGNAVLFESGEPNSQTSALKSNLSRRGPNGWTGQNIIPPQSRAVFICLASAYAGFSPNLDQILIRDGISETVSGESRNPEDCDHDEPRLFPNEEQQEAANLFLRATASGRFQLVNPKPALGTPQRDPWFDAISADGSHVVFQSKALLTTNAPSTETETETCHTTTDENGDVYIWNAGVIHLLTVLPNGEAARGTLAGGHGYFRCQITPVQSANVTQALSPEGKRVLFYAGGGFEYDPEMENVGPQRDAPYVDGGLYLREHPDAEESALKECTTAEQGAEPGKACTIQIDVPEQGAPSGAKAGEGQFQWANAEKIKTANGEAAEMTKVFFTDEQRLVEGATAEAGKPDLYEYDLNKPEGERLTDLTVNAAEPADVLGVSGASEDGSYLYFVAKGALSGNQENSHGAKAMAGKANLYLRHAGATTFIASLGLDTEDGDACDWTAYCLTARVSQNGLFIAFDSFESLTEYDNRPVQPNACGYLASPFSPVSGRPCPETFRYAASNGAHGELTCASCNPTGAAPASEFAWSVIEQAGRDIAYGGRMQFSHNISDSGQVFFDTMEQLVPADENKTWDVYEYEGGEGATAQLHLISTGKNTPNTLPSYFDDATPDGSNVFFFTAESLLRTDTRADYDLYDARVGGGFAVQNEPIQRPPCESERDCRSPLTEPPAELSVASAAFAGPGNLLVKSEHSGAKKPAKCKKNQVRRHGQCVRTRHKGQRRHHGKHAKHHGKKTHRQRTVGK